MNFWHAWGEGLEFIYNSTFTRGSFKNLKHILTWFVHQIFFYGEHVSEDVVFNLFIEGEEGLSNMDIAERDFSFRLNVRGTEI